MKESIILRNLSKNFEDLIAIDDIELVVYEGEMFGLIGPDGAGKTTLIKILTGLLSPTKGNVQVLGYELPKEKSKLKKEIGYLSQNFSLYLDLTVEENIKFFAEIHRRKNFHSEMDELLRITRLASFRKSLANELSGGMKQKLALICTLIHHPKILFLDEPTTGVDPISRRDFWQILSELNQNGITIFMSTPYLDEAERCHRISLINSGRILVTDSPDNLRNNFEINIIEVVCNPIKIAFEVLKEFKNYEIQLFGDKIDILIPKTDESKDKIVNKLRQNRIEIISLKEKRASLENIFINLILRHKD